jgi:hypothetical protein
LRNGFELLSQVRLRHVLTSSISTWCVKACKIAHAAALAAAASAFAARVLCAWALRLWVEQRREAKLAEVYEALAVRFAGYRLVGPLVSAWARSARAQAERTAAAQRVARMYRARVRTVAVADRT